MATTAVLQLVKREGKWYAERKSLQRALKKGKEDPAKTGTLKPEGNLVFVEAFVGGLQRIALAHKAYSADKKLFAGYYRDGFDEVISIHDAKSGKQIRRIVGHGDDVQELKFTPDGKLLASRCENRGRKGWALWSVESGELVLRLPVSDD
jgi:WD40 repeat protein